jgi:Domain of unknown function (DUF4505)
LASGKFIRKDSKTRQSVLKQFESTRFASIIKDKDFYEKHAAPRNAVKTGRRSYFYNVDLQAQLFLEETMPKNIATSIKDAKFLDFFFRRLQPIDETIQAYMREHDISTTEYPFVSPCAGEFNFVRPAASPVVFHTLNKGPAHDASSFIYAGSLTEPFDPAGSLAISQNSGLMYHRIQSSAAFKNQYALLKSSIAVSICEHVSQHAISPEDTNRFSDLAFRASDDRMFPIPWLPLHAEPGSCAMPVVKSP